MKRKGVALIILFLVSFSFFSIANADPLYLAEKKWDSCIFDEEFYPSNTPDENFIYIRNRPSIFGEKIGVIRVYKDKAEFVINGTGRAENGWVEVEYQGVKGWILGEFVGIKVEAEYEEFDQPVVYLSTTERIVARCEPTILSGCCGFGLIYGTILNVVGKQGLWYKIKVGDKFKWVYHELLEPAKTTKRFDF